MKVKYLAHSAVQLTNKTYNIIIDPFITENPNSPMAINDIDVDYIILTHAHGDHLGDAIEIALRCNSTIICVNELGIYLSNKGLKVHKMHIGGGYNFPFGRVK
ncbi:MAG: MBL fold metallo-hydrolase, partial [Candidatus Kapabacteria bacterium]|nr:MBL fold metallo-hydrolase [Candidatus Kapabacteria bacterium]